METGVFLNYAWFRFLYHCDFLCLDFGFVEVRVKQEGFENDEN